MGKKNDPQMRVLPLINHVSNLYKSSAPFKPFLHRNQVSNFFPFRCGSYNCPLFPPFAQMKSIKSIASFLVTMLRPRCAWPIHHSIFSSVHHHYLVVLARHLVGSIRYWSASSPQSSFRGHPAPTLLFLLSGLAEDSAAFDPLGIAQESAARIRSFAQHVL